MSYKYLILGHGLGSRNGMIFRRLNQNQIHNCLARLPNIRDRVDKGLEIFERNCQEDAKRNQCQWFANENELLDHVVVALRQNGLNRPASEVVKLKLESY